MATIIPDSQSGVRLSWTYRYFVASDAMEIWRRNINEHEHGTNGVQISHNNLSNVNGPTSASNAFHFPSETAYDALIDGVTPTSNAYPADAYHRHAGAGVEEVYIGHYNRNQRTAGKSLTDLVSDTNVRAEITNLIINRIPGSHPLSSHITLGNLKAIRAIGSFVPEHGRGLISGRFHTKSTVPNSYAGCYFVKSGLLGSGYVGPHVLLSTQPQSTTDESKANNVIQYVGMRTITIGTTSHVSYTANYVGWGVNGSCNETVVFWQVTGLGWHVEPTS